MYVFCRALSHREWLCTCLATTSSQFDTLAAYMFLLWNKQQDGDGKLSSTPSHTPPFSHVWYVASVWLHSILSLSLCFFSAVLCSAVFSPCLTLALARLSAHGRCWSQLSVNGCWHGSQRASMCARDNSSTLFRLSLSLCPFSSFIWFVCGVLQNDIATCDVMQNAERHANPSSCSVSMDAMCMTTSEVEGIRCGVRCGSALQTQRHTPYLSTATIYGIRWPLMMRPAYARSLYAGRRTQTVSAHIATVVRRSQSGIGHYDVNELRHWFSDVVVGYTLSEDIIYMQHRRWTVAVKNARMDRMGDGNKMFAKCSRWRKCGWQI